MAFLKILALDEPERPTATFAMKCDYYLRRAEEQKALAREMINKAQQMYDCAVEMRKPPRCVLP